MIVKFRTDNTIEKKEKRSKGKQQPRTHNKEN